MSVEIKTVTNKSDLREFIFLPSKLYSDRPTWVPPMYMDEWKFYNPKENTSLAHCESIQFLAYQNNEYQLPKLEDSFATQLKEKLTQIQYKLAEDTFGWTVKV